MSTENRSMHEYARLYLDGGVASVQEWQDFLRTLHGEHPGAGHALTHHYTTNLGVSSYQVLADVAATCAARPLRLLDIGCGDGALFTYLDEALRAVTVGIGVDITPEQVELARQRFSDEPAFRFRMESADALTEESGSVDCVVCHGALGEMSPLDAVLREVARVVKPGGAFAATLQTNKRLEGAPEYQRALREFFIPRFPQCSFPPPGDARAAEPHTLTAMLEESGFEDVVFTPMTTEMKDSPGRLWDALATLSYHFNMLCQDERDALRAHVVPALERDADSQGLVTLKLVGALLTARRAACG